MKFFAPRLAVAGVLVAATVAPATGGAVETTPQPLPVSITDPGNTGTTVYGNVKPVPVKYEAATDVESVRLAVKMLAPAKDKQPVKTLVVTYRMGDVLPATTKGLKSQRVSISLHNPNDDDSYDYNQFHTTVAAPRRVGFFDGPSFGDGTKCGYARTDFAKNVIRQFIPIRRCVGTEVSEDAIITAGLELTTANTDPGGYRAAWNDQVHTGPLSYELP